jgi:hypothetical protein
MSMATLFARSRSRPNTESSYWFIPRELVRAAPITSAGRLCAGRGSFTTHKPRSVSLFSDCFVERFSTLPLRRPPSTASLTSLDGTVALRLSIFRYRALAALDLGELAHQLPPAAVQIVLDRLALRGHAVAVRCAVQRYR